MVIIVIWMMLLAEVYGGLMKKLPLPMPYPWKLQVEKSGDVIELTQPKKKQELTSISQFERVNPHDMDYYHTREALISVKTWRHRNKRYTSYTNNDGINRKRIASAHGPINRLRHSSDIALCPFKVCYMGRKRLTSRRFSRKIALG
ncbi:unnamed protein product [Acanthoscelides obtectus]|uniref:Uncharacterized protein n=1 Tax=Acanthoscelides obtectus TaxID=200917 RepID=A0A9P0L774_ACAOB|nr:unnamed protein product [Acanthoscelides obtectus]CAK1658957.1 hypothetical protein AOBTE_LOCUS21209 [Acanthoscelides obtectus]